MDLDIDFYIPEFFYKLKEIPLFKHAVIAGGYLRDQVYGIKARDIDIFVPTPGSYEYQSGLYTYWSDILKAGIEQSPHDKISTYSKAGLTSKLDLVTNDPKLGKVDIDLMSMRLNVKGFVPNLIEDCPWANQQVAHDGKKLITTEAFRYDIENNTMSLVRAERLTELPKLFEKYNYLTNEAGVKVKFRTDYILAKRSGDDWL